MEYPQKFNRMEATGTMSGGNAGQGGPLGAGPGQAGPNGFRRYKTELCRHFEQRGSCTSGDRCNYAHGQEELRQYAGGGPQGMRGGMPMQNQIPQQQTSYGNGNMSGGGDNSNSMMSNPTALGQSGAGPNRAGPTMSGQGVATAGQTAAPGNYKTVLCKFFQEFGTCKYGTNCSYAHGEEELRAHLSARQGGPRPSGVGGQNYGGPGPNTQTIPYEPDIATQERITQMQLNSIIEGLEPLYPRDEITRTKLKSARDRTMQKDYNGAGEILNEIVYKPDSTPDERASFEKILENAINIGRTQLAQFIQQNSTDRFNQVSQPPQQQQTVQQQQQQPQPYQQRTMPQATMVNEYPQQLSQSQPQMQSGGYGNRRY